MPSQRPGAIFRECLTQHRPLPIAGTINAYCALMAQKAGFHAIYLSGAGVANASYGLPDLGITQLTDVLTDAARITDAVPLPLLVDIDTGLGNSAFQIARTVKSLINANAAAIHLEDQMQSKRCGHRPGKQLASTQEMCDRLKAALDARTCPHFFIMARTDAIANEGLTAAIERAQAYVEIGADAIFAEACTSLDEYRAFKKALPVPILANITEFGKTPLWTHAELANAGVDMILHPLSAFRAMNKAALEIYQTILDKQTVASALAKMQTRDELYEVLNYLAFEKKLDALFGKGETT